MPKKQPAPERTMPHAPEAEKLILGLILLDDRHFPEVSSVLSADDFSLDVNRRIYIRMQDLANRNEKIDRVTVYNELSRHAEQDLVGGLSYIVSLDDKMPALASVGAYVKILKTKSTLRRLAYAGQSLMTRALSAQDDPEEIAREAEMAISGLTTEQATDGLRTTEEIIRAYEGGVNAFLDPSRRRTGIPTGFKKLDYLTGGLKAGELIIVGARPSMGKTSLALNVAWNVAVKAETPVAFFSLEMSEEQIINRMLCTAAQVDSYKFKFGTLDEEERSRIRRAMVRLTDAPFYITDHSSISLASVRASLRRLQAKRKGKIGLTVVDYLQLMGSSGSKAENRNQEIGQITRGFKLMAKDFGCPFLVLSQLSRPDRGAIKRPELSDLRDSGSIEQDADVVAFIWRESMLRPEREDLKGLAELLLRKQRDGATGVVNLKFEGKFTEFTNSEADDFD